MGGITHEDGITFSSTGICFIALPHSE